MLEKIVKDKDRVQSEFNTLKNDLELTVNLLFRAILGSEEADKMGPSLSWKEKIEQCKGSHEKLKAQMKIDQEELALRQK